jgi:hypothetical protein
LLRAAAHAHASDVSGRPGSIHHEQRLVRGAGSSASDEAAADALRRKLHEHGIIPIAPDERVRWLLGPDECVVAVRRSVLLERRLGSPDAGHGLSGDLYVTTRRLLLLGQVPVAYALTDVHEVDVVAGAVRLVVEQNHGVDIRVSDPRVLRVEIAAVRERLRRAAPLVTAGLGQESFR